MKKSNYTLFLSLGIFIVTTIIVALFGVVPLPEYEVISKDTKLNGKLLYHVEIQSKNLIPPAPDIMDECILSIDLSIVPFKEEKIICGSDLFSLSYDIYFYDKLLETIEYELNNLVNGNEQLYKRLSLPNPIYTRALKKLQDDIEPLIKLQKILSSVVGGKIKSQNRKNKMKSCQKSSKGGQTLRTIGKLNRKCRNVESY